MKVSRAIRFGGWFILLLILLLGAGSIATFTRMSPAIETILKQNEKSLDACEQMLASLVLMQSAADQTDELRMAIARFDRAYEIADGNVTEPGEDEALQRINALRSQGLAGEPAAISETVDAISTLTRINREAMHRADDRARRLGNAGAWGVVFMTLGVFTAGLIYIRSVREQLVGPLSELYDVVVSTSGTPYRRCVRHRNLPDVAMLFDRVNQLLDRPG